MRDTLTNKLLIKNFRDFVALWLRTGFEWYKKDPKIMEGWRFGHDWNNDFSNKSYKNQLPKIPLELRDSICCSIEMLIATNILDQEAVDYVVGWLCSGSTVRKPGYKFYNRVYTLGLWVLYGQLKHIENLLIDGKD